MSLLLSVLTNLAERRFTGRVGHRSSFWCEHRILYQTSDCRPLRDEKAENSALSAFFAAISGTATKMARSWCYGKIILQIWTCWNRTDIWNRNSSFHGPAEDFGESAGAYVGRQTQKTSFLRKCAEIKVADNIRKMYASGISENE